MDFTIKQLDHLGVIAGSMQDLKVAAEADMRLGTNEQMNVTHGEIIEAMILNGLGFSNRPISLTPQFFVNKPLDLLIRDGITGDQLNRHKIGRTLDAIATYGCEEFFNETALTICVAEKIDLSRLHNDTTNFSLEGAFENQEEDVEVHINHGYSKAKRPDLKQIVLELVVSRDGSVPFMMKPWSGNAADNNIFNARIKSLHQATKDSHTGRILLGDAKLYTEKNILELGTMYFITRVPGSIALARDYVAKALADNIWTVIKKKEKSDTDKAKNDQIYKYRSFDLEHYGTKMRWVVIYSQQAHERAKKTLSRVIKKKTEQLTKELFHLQAKRFECGEDAKNALDAIAKKYPYYRISAPNITTTEHYKTRGRPTLNAKKVSGSYQVTATFELVQAAVDDALEHDSCFVLATNVPEAQLASASVLGEYKGQDCVEKSFGFIKDPSFFAASFFLKSVSRIQALLVIMTLALLVYTVAQRRLRQWLTTNKKTIPNQIKKETERPTLRWAFQLLEGIYNVKVMAIPGKVQIVIQGITDLKRLILSGLGKNVARIYGLDAETSSA